MIVASTYNAIQVVSLSFSILNTYMSENAVSSHKCAIACGANVDCGVFSWSEQQVSFFGDPCKIKLIE